MTPHERTLTRTHTSYSVARSRITRLPTRSLCLPRLAEVLRLRTTRPRLGAPLRSPWQRQQAPPVANSKRPHHLQRWTTIPPARISTMLTPRLFGLRHSPPPPMYVVLHHTLRGGQGE